MKLLIIPFSDETADDLNSRSNNANKRLNRQTSGNAHRPNSQDQEITYVPTSVLKKHHGMELRRNPNGQEVIENSSNQYRQQPG